MKTPARKQSLDHADFARIRARAVLDIPRPSLDSKVSQAVDDVRRFCWGKNVAYAWSGGKDSIALGLIAQLAGIDQCVLAITDLEYPAFLGWVTQHMPDGLEVINTGQDLDWLVARPAMLFPQDAGTAAMWFAQVQHAAQRRFYKARRLDALLLGRRRQDGNFVGRDGENHYAADGVLRYSPIADWTHAEVFALIDHYGLAMPPIYDWARGYRCGTHPWAARQWCRGIADGWREVHQIDPAIVVHAATRIRSAAEFLEAL